MFADLLDNPNSLDMSNNMFADLLPDNKILPLERRFQQPNTAPLPSAEPVKMISAHEPRQSTTIEPSILQKLGKGLTESITGGIGYKLGAALANGDFRTPTPMLPDYQPKTLGDKALDFVGSNLGDAGLWMAG